MKKLILFIILFLGFAMVANAQLTTTSGITRYAKDAYIGAGDSLHVIGTVTALDCDSMQWFIAFEDTINAEAIVGTDGGGLYTPTDTAAAVYITAATGVAAVTCIEWNQIKSVLSKTKNVTGLKFYIRIDPTLSAMASLGKRYRTWVHKFKH